MEARLPGIYGNYVTLLFHLVFQPSKAQVENIMVNCFSNVSIVELTLLLIQISFVAHTLYFKFWTSEGNCTYQ